MNLSTNWKEPHGWQSVRWWAKAEYWSAKHNVAGFMCSAIVGAFKRPEDNGVVFAVQGVVMRKSSVEMARPSCGLEWVTLEFWFHARYIITLNLLSVLFSGSSGHTYCFLLAGCSPDVGRIFCWIWWCSLSAKTVAEEGLSSWLTKHSYGSVLENYSDALLVLVYWMSLPSKAVYARNKD